MPTLEEMSGERKKSPKLVLDEIVLNGQEGKYYYRHVTRGLEKDTDGRERYPVEPIGDSVELVFLKVRRKLTAFRKGERNLMTNEHNYKGDTVRLFGIEGQTIVNTAEVLREQYPLLKTTQVVYALYQGKLVRLFVKGASLGSNNKADGVHDFYSYIASFKKGNRDDHFYDRTTKLYVVKEKGDLGSYFCMGFSEGDVVPPEEMKEVEKFMAVAYEFAKQTDAFYGLGDTAKDKPEQAVRDSSIPAIEYGDGEEPEDSEEIGPEDIPF